MMMRTGQNRGGFTLIELLLALAIASVIMVALFNSVYTAYRAKTSAEDAMAPSGELGIAMDLLARDLASARPATGVLSYQFEGTQNGDDNSPSDDVLFFAPTGSPADPPSGPDLVNVQNGGGASGLGQSFQLNMGTGSNGGNNTAPLLTDVRQVEYYVKQVDGTNCLVRDVTSNLLADETPDPEEEVLARNVQGFRVEYYDGTEWNGETWDSTTTDPVNELPAAVRITLDLAPLKPGGVRQEIVKVVSLACYADLTLVNNTTTTGGQ